MGLKKHDDNKYINILGSDGTLRLVVPEGTEGCEKREYELKDGTKGVKYELVFDSIDGKITDIEFYEGKFGKNILLTVTDSDGELTLSANVAQPFGEDIMKKLPNINLEKEVVLAPYSFTDDKGKSRKGMTITQNGNKITNFFYDFEAKTNINGYPDPKPKKGDKPYTTDDWKVYFIEARNFLTDYVEENILPKFGHAVEEKTEDVLDNF